MIRIVEVTTSPIAATFGNSESAGAWASSRRFRPAVNTISSRAAAVVATWKPISSGTFGASCSAIHSGVGGVAGSYTGPALIDSWMLAMAARPPSTPATAQPRWLVGRAGAAGPLPARPVGWGRSWSQVVPPPKSAGRVADVEPRWPARAPRHQGAVSRLPGRFSSGRVRGSVVVVRFPSLDGIC